MFKVVLAQGCFDLSHVAHLRHLKEARDMGTLLVVGVTRDSKVCKGAGRPIYPESERLEMVRGFGCVFDAELCDDAVDALKRWKPAIFVKGHDRKEIGLLPEEEEYCNSHGIEIRFTKPNPQHTAAIIERIKCLA